MADVFLSYASEDRELANKLANALEARGWTVWWDRRIGVGKSYDQVIEQELGQAKCVVALWSWASINSEWVKNEAAIAAERGVLVPALIEEVKIPLEFRRKQAANLIDWQGGSAHAEFQKLCEGIANFKKPNKDPRPEQPPERDVLPKKQRRFWIVSGLLSVLFAVGAYWYFHLAEQHAQIKPYRSSASTVANDQLNAMLVTYGFFDEVRNARGKGVINKFEQKAINDAVVVVDHATGLMWQKGGSDAMPLTEAGNYIVSLNSEKFAGFSDWHLPTLDEALTLMEPEKYSEYYIDPVFQKGVNFIWTADRTTEGHGWVTYFYNGIVRPEVANFNASVRAVRKF